MARVNPFPIQEPPDNKYGADPIARWLADMIVSEGIVLATDLAVTERSSGVPNLSVDVAAGDAYVEFSIPYGGMRRVRSDALSNSGTPGALNTPDWSATFFTPDPTRSRLDRVVLEVKDDTLDFSGLFESRFRVVRGSPRSTASLVTLDGAAAVPDNAILLANVLVGAGASAITNADIDTTVRARASLVGRDSTFLVERKVLSTDGVFEFLSIPQTYKHLLLVGALKAVNDTSTNTTALTADVNAAVVILNGDQSAVYDLHRIITYTDDGLGFNFAQSQAGGSQNTGLEPTTTLVNATSGVLGELTGGDEDLADNKLRFSTLVALVPGYTGTATHKISDSMMSMRSHLDESVIDPSKWIESRRGVHWAKTQAITRVQVFARDGTTFKAGSELALYGLG